MAVRDTRERSRQSQRAAQDKPGRRPRGCLWLPVPRDQAQARRRQNQDTPPAHVPPTRPGGPH
eukprot:8455011-Lingulodinium_polyedra.AAC.1